MEGSNEGLADGTFDGELKGWPNGFNEGLSEGSFKGFIDGSKEGFNVGPKVLSRLVLSLKALMKVWVKVVSMVSRK